VLSAEGGFGRTYLAEDSQKLNETCVIKQLAPKQSGTYALKKATELFIEEAKRLQDLGEHPQIPTLFAYFEDNGFLYLVQQFIKGENLLDELAQKGKYKETQIRELLLDLLPSLKFIHERQVIHRDIKPQNIMRRASDGKLVLIDFGASKQLTTTVHTQIGTRIGTDGYSPLEQIQLGEAYPASDLFALGATCFHLLTGVHPFNLWTRNGFSWVNNWRQHLPSPVSQELGKVLDKLLKIEILERYQSADEVINDLSQTVQEPTVSVPRRVSVLGLALLAGLLGYWGYWQLKSPTIIISSPAPFSSQPPPSTIQRTLDNLSPNWVIQANSSITLNNQPFPAESFFQVIEKKTNPNNGNNPDVRLRLCEKSNPALETSKIVQVNFSELQDLARDISILQSDQPSPCEWVFMIPF
jgi:serine/threonine protein kinase